MTNHRYVIVATGEGAMARVIDAKPFLYKAIHDFLCCCGLSLSECKDLAVQEIVRMIDDPNEWENDEGGEPFSVTSRGETGAITIYRLSD